MVLDLIAMCALNGVAKSIKRHWKVIIWRRFLCEEEDNDDDNNNCEEI